METWCSIDVSQGSEYAYEGDSQWLQKWLHSKLQKWLLSFLSVRMWIRFSVEAISKTNPEWRNEWMNETFTTVRYYIIPTLFFLNIHKSLNIFPTQSFSLYKLQFTEKFILHLASKPEFKNEIQEWIFCSKKKLTNK